MTKKSLVVVTGSLDAPGAILLRDAAQASGLNASLALIDSPQVADEINNADYVLYRVAARTHPLFTALEGRLNDGARRSLRAVLNAFDKETANEFLLAHEIPTPHTYSIGREDTIDEYPKVVKILSGNQGIGVSLVRSEEELRAYRDEFKNEARFVVQEYIEESKGNDARLFVIGDTVCGAMRRVSQSDDFRANLHLGGRMEPYEPSELECDYAVRAAKALGLQYAGVDIIQSHRGPLVLEVNSSPGFGVQAVTRIDLPLAVITELTGVS